MFSVKKLRNTMSPGIVSESKSTVLVSQSPKGQSLRGPLMGLHALRSRQRADFGPIGLGTIRLLDDLPATLENPASIFSEQGMDHPLAFTPGEV